MATAEDSSLGLAGLPARVCTDEELPYLTLDRGEGVPGVGVPNSASTALLKQHGRCK